MIIVHGQKNKMNIYVCYTSVWITCNYVKDMILYIDTEFGAIPIIFSCIKTADGSIGMIFNYKDIGFACVEINKKQSCVSIVVLVLYISCFPYTR